MTLIQTILEAQKEAMKKRDAETLSILRVLSSAAKNEQIEKQRELTDAEVQQVIARQVKQLKDALSDFEKARRTDLVDKTKKEVALLSAYLPQQLSDEELKAVIMLVVETNKGTEPGRIMGPVMKEVAGRADGSRVKAMLETLAR